jgi:hypothetical protein
MLPKVTLKHEARKQINIGKQCIKAIISFPRRFFLFIKEKKSRFRFPKSAKLTPIA